MAKKWIEILRGAANGSARRCSLFIRRLAGRRRLRLARKVIHSEQLVLDWNKVAQLSPQRFPRLITRIAWRGELQLLAREQRTERTFINVRKSAAAYAATLRPTMVKSEMQKSPEYLFLIDVHRP